MPLASTELADAPAGEARLRAVIVKDDRNYVPLTNILDDDDVLLLLTPVVIPTPLSGGETMDPFEVLGRALAARHPHVRHVPYTAKNGITRTHTEFINLARVIIFVVSGAPGPGQTSQLDNAELVLNIGQPSPLILIACRNIPGVNLLEKPFSSIVQLSGFAPETLREAAALLIRERPPTREPSSAGLVGSGSVTTDDSPTLSAAPSGFRYLTSQVSSAKSSAPVSPSLVPVNWRVTYVQQGRLDIVPIQHLWNECMPKKFHLPQHTLRGLLDQEGYARHSYVSDSSGQMLGFCATYLNFFADEPSNLVGCIALILVRPDARGKGIGRSLHNEAMHYLDENRRSRGIRRYMLGSTFPRLLHGIPVDSASEGWFQRRGWSMDYKSPGCGQEVCDWILDFDDWPSGRIGPASSDLFFRQCTQDELRGVAAFVTKESFRRGTPGWHDQYMLLDATEYVQDIVIGQEGPRLVASAIIYTPNTESNAAQALPWAGTLGPDVGGVTCICVPDGSSMMSNSKDIIMIRLLDKCIQLLKSRGMKRLFLDGIKGGEEGFLSLGFQKWARYRDVWRDV